MRTMRSSGWSVLVSIAIGGGVLAGHASVAQAQTGWGNIIISADPLLVNSVPSPAQLSYQTKQYGAFLHYGPAVFLSGQGTYDDMEATPDPSVFNPTNLDVNQWVTTAKSFDAKYIVFSAKHHNGFCNWQTQTTSYGVSSSPWENGQGDLVRELGDACRANGIGLGLYFSGHDRDFPCYKLDNGTIVGNIAAYWPVYKQQLTELLSNYGNISCLWLDHYQDPFSWNGLTVNPATGKPYLDEIAALARQKQPNMVIWGGSQPDVHFLNNENGTAPYPLSNVILPGQGPTWSLPPSTKGWVIPEAENTESTFAWVPRTPSQLMDQYLVSVGRGTNFLQAMVPGTDGLIDSAQAQTLGEFGAMVRSRFGNPLAETNSNNGWLQPGVLELDLGGVKKINDIVLEEDIALGQHVVRYALDVWTKGAWQNVLSNGLSIGRERIEQIGGIIGEKVRLRILQANAVPNIKVLSVMGISQEVISPATIYDHFSGTSLDPAKWNLMRLDQNSTLTFSGSRITQTADARGGLDIRSTDKHGVGTIFSFQLGPSAPTTPTASSMVVFGAWDPTTAGNPHIQIGNWQAGWNVEISDGTTTKTYPISAPLGGELYTVAWTSDSVTVSADGWLIATESLAVPGAECSMFAQSFAGYGGTIELDYIGITVPEPPLVASLTSGVIAVLCYALRKPR
jgi:alpha-L-fucosidase